MMNSIGTARTSLGFPKFGIRDPNRSPRVPASPSRKPLEYVTKCQGTPTSVHNGTAVGQRLSRGDLPPQAPSRSYTLGPRLFTGHIVHHSSLGSRYGPGPHGAVRIRFDGRPAR